MIYREFIDAGIPIFPLYPIVDGNCSCSDPDCTSIGKHPIVNGWQYTPLWSDEQLETIEELGQLATGYGVLVSTGGLLVVDVDARNGGVTSAAKLPVLDKCGFVVETGSGGGSRHYYFKAPQGMPLVYHHDDYPGIEFKSSGYVVGPGSLHESGNTYTILYGDPQEITEAPTELIDLLRRPNHHRAEYNGHHVDVSQNDIRDMLAYIPNDDSTDYETYIRIGMAIHHSTGGTGIGLWEEWAQRSSKYKSKGRKSSLEKRWHSFGKSATLVTFGTLAHYAEQGGWIQPVTFTPDIDLQDSTPTSLPFSTAGIDLLRPPGFVGEVTAWINSQCRFPRESLAVAAALVSIGNICGLRYEDDLSGITANLFAFCVAASSTGKEAVQQAQIEIHKAAGISLATYGSIKSEQEIVRNAVRHQGIFYIIDELGILLQKIINAQKRGGAAYLDGVIGELMKIYSKANGYYLLTGDMREDVRSQLYRELDNEKDGEKTKQIELAISKLDQGLERPFLSMIGYTTPSTFHSITTKDQAESGFLGRALLISERDSNPKPKPGFIKSKMPESMRAALQNLYAPGYFNITPGRIQQIGAQSTISTTPQAIQMMSLASDWLFNDYAEQHKELSGLEAIVRRGYEMMAKISLILAIPGGIRTPEHVRWAFAVMKRDIDEKIRIVMGTEETNEHGLAARILGYISADHAESTGVLVNKCRPNRKEDIIETLSRMEAKGLIIKENHKHPRRKDETVDKWRASS